MKLFTVGYGKWPAATRMTSLLATLERAAVDLLVDVRHSPCSPALSGSYGPKPWNLQATGGIREHLLGSGIDYAWLGELGNPQKNDPEMTILRRHLADPEGRWPVHRGLAALAALVDEGRACALLCACAKHGECHRRLIADALARLRPVEVVPL